MGVLKIAVVGAGWVTTARHLPALRRSGRCEIVGIIDRNLDRARQAAAKFDLPRYADRLDASWLDGADACTVGVAPMAHFEVAVALLERDKHVLLEKPMAMTLAEGEALAAQAVRHRRTLAIVHNFQFARSVKRAQAALAAGRWGKVTALFGLQLGNPRRRLPVWYEELPLGLFYDESPHLFYLVRAFAGDVAVRWVNALPSTRGQRTPALINVEFDADIPVTLSMNFEAPVSEWQFAVLTERGVALIDLFRDILVFLPEDGPHGPWDITRSSLALLGGHAAGFVRSGLRLVAGRLSYGNDEVVRRFLDAVEGRGPAQGIAAEDALAVLRLQHAILDRVPGQGARP